MSTNSRRDFLKKSGILGAASIIPFGNILAETNNNNKQLACTLIPTETAGPFPLDLTANTSYFRKDIREGKTGVQLNLKLKIIGASNCFPMENLRVNIWHCDKDGLYSGYSQTNNPGQAGLTYLRGYQISDSNGEVEFVTIFPGWYSGRICHIHFQVYVSSSYAAISQLTFPVDTKQSLYSNNSSLYTKGSDPMSLTSDNIFSDGYAYQLATLTPNTNTGGYDSYLEVTIQGNGIATSLGNLEKENNKNFSLGQNYPNPYENETTIPFVINSNSDVTLTLFDLQGRMVYSIEKKNLTSGEHNINILFDEIGIASENYAYQITVKNKNGIYTDNKLMTARH